LDLRAIENSVSGGLPPILSSPIPDLSTMAGVTSPRHREGCALGAKTVRWKRASAPNLGIVDLRDATIASRRVTERGCEHRRHRDQRQDLVQPLDCARSTTTACAVR
jgi:hypothetical protein